MSRIITIEFEIPDDAHLGPLALLTWGKVVQQVDAEGTESYSLATGGMVRYNPDHRLAQVGPEKAIYQLWWQTAKSALEIAKPKGD